MEFGFSAGCVGPLTVGMTRETVRKTLNGKFSVFQKSEFAANTTDAYDGLGVYVYYSPENVIEAAEIFSDSASLMYRGKDLLASNYSDICSFLQKEGILFSEDESEVHIIGDNIRLYIPDRLESKTAKVDSAYVELIGS